MAKITVRNKKLSKRFPQSSGTKTKEVQDSRGVLLPMWGMVIEAYSADNSVDVTLRNGLILRHVTVNSREWAGANANNGYGEQDLPPVDCEVLVVFPDGIIEEAFIIGSRLETLGDIGDELKNNLLVEDRERFKATVTEYGWKITYDKDNGDWKLEHPNDADFLLEIDEQNKTITIKDWEGSYIKLSSAGIVIEDKNVNVFTLDSSGVIIKDPNNNVITMGLNGILLEDANSNTVSMESGKVAINGTHLEVT